MDIRQLKIFLKVCEVMSFTKAAKALSYAQSTISDSIQNLEKQMDKRLFDRLGKRIYLTEEGKRLKLLGQELLVHYNDVMTDFMNGKSRLRIGITESLCSYKFPDFFSSFLSKHPHVEIVFDLLRCEMIPEKLRDNSIDIGLTLDEKQEYSDLESIQLFEEEIILIAGKPIVSIENENRVIPKGEGYMKDFHAYYEKGHIKKGHTMYVESIEGIKSFVKSGFGISFLPRTTVEKELSNNALYTSDSFSVFHEVKILIHKDKNISVTLKELIDETLKEFKVL